VLFESNTMVGQVPTSCGKLQPGEGLIAGMSIWSCDGRFQLIMQTDGNLVLYAPGIGAIWASNTYLSPAVAAVMRGDGVLSVRGKNGQEYFTTNTAGNNGAFLWLKDDGNLVIHNSATNSDPFQSNTIVGPPPPANSAPMWSAYVDYYSPLYRTTDFASAPTKFGLTQVGIANKGVRYVFCKAWAGEVRNGSAYNHWWLWTDADIGGAGDSWVSAYYLQYWGNDQALDDYGSAIPNCTLNPNPPPNPPPIPATGAPLWVPYIDPYNFQFYWTTTFANAPAYRGGTQVGTLTKGMKFAFCKAWGGVVGSGSAYNHWWLWADPDVGYSDSAWVSAYYLAKWGNDQALDDSGNMIPDCQQQ